MSYARDRILAVLDDRCGYYTPGHRERTADLLMPIVRDTVAEGFETAADIFEHPDPEGHLRLGRTPAELLRQYANDARVANQPMED